MKVFRRVGALALISLTAALAPSAAITQASAASFSPAPGLYTVDTSALTLTGPGTSITGVDQGGIAVFSFESINIPVGVEIEAEGSRPFELKSAGAFTLAGVIEASGFDASSETAGPNPGGPGGGAGGMDGTQAGSGPGGGGTGAEYNDGGGGGGFGGVGATGGTQTIAGGAGGAVYGNLNALLQGGSGGAGGTTPSHPPVVGGGGGGGAVALLGSSLTIDATGEVLAEGGSGSGGDFGASGGGSGGGILLHASTIHMAGTLSAIGGDGGTGGCCGAGGGGGGGRIAYQYVTSLTRTGTEGIAGGTSGASGTFSPGILGTPEGGAGVITTVRGATATTTSASSLTDASATLNGTVNPNGNATTYHFEYGTTTAYGSVAPAPDAAVGSDGADHPLSLAIANLKPKTTYHYRIVATDALGFTSPGADASFTTAPFPFKGVTIGKQAKVKKGAAWLKLSSAAACKGKVKLSVKAKGANGKKKTIKLGSASFSLSAGKKKTVKVKLSAAGLVLLEEGGSLKAKAAAKASAAGVSKTTKRTVTLKLAKKH
jgi:hypothetical protein